MEKARDLCIHPNYDSDGKELENNQWSCLSCNTFLNSGLSGNNRPKADSSRRRRAHRALRTAGSENPLNDTIRAAATFFCEEQQECKSEFATVIEITGVLGKTISEKNSIDEVCRSVMLCKR